MTNFQKLSLTLSLRNTPEDTHARQIARFSCICPRLIVSLSRKADDLHHLVAQTYWIKKDVSPLFRSQKTAKTQRRRGKRQTHVRGINTGCYSVSAYGHLAVPLRRQKHAVRVFLCQ